MVSSVPPFPNSQQCNDRLRSTRCILMTVSRDSFSLHVREYVLQQIASGELSPGERIVEARVAQHFDISAIPVREAIRELVTMRVLESAPHRGAWVRDVSLQETIEAFQIRSVLEPLAAPAAATALCGRANHLRKLGRSLVTAARRRDFVKFQRHNQEFHRTIIQVADNGVLLRVWDSLESWLREVVVLESTFWQPSGSSYRPEAPPHWPSMYAHVSSWTS
jgi:DNA-binding GntR family transcriptional regulator